MTVHRIPVKVRIEVTVRGVNVTTFPLTDKDLQWEQGATLLLDIRPPSNKKPTTSQEASE